MIPCQLRVFLYVIAMNMFSHTGLVVCSTKPSYKETWELALFSVATESSVDMLEQCYAQANMLAKLISLDVAEVLLVPKLVCIQIVQLYLYGSLLHLIDKPRKTETQMQMCLGI